MSPADPPTLFAFATITDAPSVVRGTVEVVVVVSSAGTLTSPISGIESSTVAAGPVRASRSCTARHGTVMLIVSGRYTTNGASTGRVPVVALGQVIVDVSCTTGRIGNSTARTVPSR